ncbi:cAMP-dependent protein kinase catalytic subunit, partial [Coemansia sp. Benny D115]
MFGRLNAKLAHLKATSSQRAQPSDTASSAGLLPASSDEHPASPATATHHRAPSSQSTASSTPKPAAPVPAPASVSVSVSASAATSGAASPLQHPVSSFQAARAAVAAKGLSLAIQQRPQEPTASRCIPDTPALRSYHIYVETPSENSYPPALSPTTPAQASAAPEPSLASASNKRRLSGDNSRTSSPRPAHTALDGVNTKQTKHTRLESYGAEPVLHADSPLPVPAFTAAAHQHQQHQLSHSANSIPHHNHHYHHYQQQPQSQPQLQPQPQPQQHYQQQHYHLPLLSQPIHSQLPTQPPVQPQPHAHYHQYHSPHHMYSSPQPDIATSAPSHPPPALPIQQMLVSGGGGITATAAAIISSCGSLPPSDGRTLEDFQLLHTLGTGTFGRVFLCQSRLTRRYFAMKVLRKSQVVKLKQVEHINNEKNILEAARHPFIVRLECTMQNERNLYMLMEY